MKDERYFAFWFKDTWEYVIKGTLPQVQKYITELTEIGECSRNPGDWKVICGHEVKVAVGPYNPEVVWL